MPKPIIEAVKRFYDQLVCCSKLVTLSPLWRRIMGFLQGSSFSFGGVLAIMHIWSCVVEDEAGVALSSYIDDSNFIAHCEGHIQRTACAYELDLEFNRLSGTVGNPAKTLFYMSSENAEAELSAAVSDAVLRQTRAKLEKVSCVRRFLLVGGEVTVRGKPGGPRSKTRRREADALLATKRSRHLLLPARDRLMIHSAEAMAKFAYGEEFCPSTVNNKKGMRSAAATAARPRGRLFASPTMMLTLGYQSHQCDPFQACTYGPIATAVRLLALPPAGAPSSADTFAMDTRREFTAAWYAYRSTFVRTTPTVHTWGNIRRLFSAFEEIGFEWIQPNLLRRTSGRCDLRLWGDDVGWTLHELRQEVVELLSGTIKP